MLERTRTVKARSPQVSKLGAVHSTRRSLTVIEVVSRDISLLPRQLRYVV